MSKTLDVVQEKNNATSHSNRVLDKVQATGETPASNERDAIDRQLQLVKNSVLKHDFSVNFSSPERRSKFMLELLNDFVAHLRYERDQFREQADHLDFDICSLEDWVRTLQDYEIPVPDCDIKLGRVDVSETFPPQNE